MRTSWLPRNRKECLVGFGFARCQRVVGYVDHPWWSPGSLVSTEGGPWVVCNQRLGGSCMGSQLLPSNGQLHVSVVALIGPM